MLLVSLAGLGQKIMLKSIEKDGPERQRLSKTCLLDERHAGARRVQKNHAERGIRPGLPVPVFCQTALFFTLLARYFICEDQIIEIGPVRELRSYQIAKHSVSSFHMRARLPPFVYNNIPYGSEICKLYLCKITRKNCKRCRRAGKNRKVPFSASAAPARAESQGRTCVFARAAEPLPAAEDFAIRRRSCGSPHPSRTPFETASPKGSPRERSHHPRPKIKAERRREKGALREGSSKPRTADAARLVTCTAMQVGFLSYAAALPTSALWAGGLHLSYEEFSESLSKNVG